MIFHPAGRRDHLLVFLTFWKYHRRMLLPSGAFADYELLPPFRQLDRQLRALTEERAMPAN